MNTAWLLRGLRAAAIIIAIAAVIDPPITSARRTRPLLSVVSADAVRDSLLIGQVTRQLDRRFTVLYAPMPAAVGTVLLGDRLPDDSRAMAAPMVVVSRARGAPSLQMRRVEAPTHAMLESRVTVTVTIATSGLDAARQQPGRALGVELLQGGVVVAQRRIAVSRDSVVTVPLSWVPSVAAPTVLQARAFMTEQPDTARNDFVVDVRSGRWSVLFYDRRPSWMSTFVRRALERDPRFAVTSRVITSTNVSRETGRPPVGLDAIAATSTFDAVVIGAPDALTSRDVDGVETLLRSRGANVLMLADHAAAGPADALLDFGGWRISARRTPAELVAPASAREPLRLKGMAIGVPARLPANATAVAVLKPASDSAQIPDTARTAIWRVPVGLGELVVSGAFDAWRFRDTAQSTFDATFRDVIDRAASQRQRPLELTLSRTLAQPRADVSIRLTSRDSMSSAPIQLSIRQAQGPDASASVIPLLPNNAGASREVHTRAPLAPGTYEVIATRGADTARAPLVVAETVFRDADNAPDLLSAWVDSRAGRVVSRDSIASLNAIVYGLVRPVPRMTTWHPMRSAWWIVPFALVLAAEWWIRRRQGLA